MNVDRTALAYHDKSMLVHLPRLFRGNGFCSVAWFQGKPVTKESTATRRWVSMVYKNGAFVTHPVKIPAKDN